MMGKLITMCLWKRAKVGSSSQISVALVADTIYQIMNAKFAMLERLNRLVSILLRDNLVISPTSILTFRHISDNVSRLIDRPFKDETSRLVIALYEAAFRTNLNTHIEEKCDICEGTIPLDALTYGICENGHQFRKFTITSAA